MSTDFAPIFEKKFHDKVVPGLLVVLDDNANPRVQVTFTLTILLRPLFKFLYQYVHGSTDCVLYSHSLLRTCYINNLYPFWGCFFYKKLLSSDVNLHFNIITLFLFIYCYEMSYFHLKLRFSITGSRGCRFGKLQWRLPQVYIDSILRSPNEQAWSYPDCHTQRGIFHEFSFLVQCSLVVYFYRYITSIALVDQVVTFAPFLSLIEGSGISVHIHAG